MIPPWFITLAVGLAVGSVVGWLLGRGQVDYERKLRRIAEEACESATAFEVGHVGVAQDEAAAAAEERRPSPYDLQLDTTAVAGFPPVAGDELGDFVQHEIRRGRPE